MGDLSQRQHVHELLEFAVQMRIGSGMSAAWGSLSDLTLGNYETVCVGKESHDQGSAFINLNTKFDLASLTKILATTALYMSWVERGLIELDDFFPGKKFTFRQLLNHSSGLPAWKPFYEVKQNIYQQVLATPLEKAPGELRVYSDLGFLLLSDHAEKLSGRSFDEIVNEEVWRKLAGSDLHYRPFVERSVVEGIAATEICLYRGWLQGEVHDDNAWAMGGVAGHAGVFGSVTGVVSWIRALISGQLTSYKNLLSFTRPALGFDFPNPDGTGSTAHSFSSGSIGHLGFTGTSLWIDFDQNRFAVLLTNRVHPSRDDLRIRDLRRLFHTVAFRT